MMSSCGRPFIARRSLRLNFLALALCGAFEAGGLRADDGIALSYDGRLWFEGAGGYGKGWGEVGNGITLERGATLYIKYYSSAPGDPILHYAPHGAPWGSWKTIGPVPAKDIGKNARSPVILKIAHAGTETSTVNCVNGASSASWRELREPGAYDLGLHYGSRWTVPPITITSPPSFWQTRWFGPRAPSPSSFGVHSVPDSSSTAGMLVGALIALPIASRLLNRRRTRS